MQDDLVQARRVLLAETRGATSIEYGIIVAGIFLVIVTPLVAIGDRLDAVYQQIGGYFS